MPAPLAWLAVVVGIGFTVEAAAGFGATLVTLSLGSLIMPTDAVLCRIVPLNLALSAVIVVRARHAVDLRVLLGRILPAMMLGMPVGLLALDTMSPVQLQRTFAAFVFTLSAVELTGMVRRRGTRGAARQLSFPAGLALLFVGGVAHGALASGGPPVVYVAARTLPDKAAFRATLSALWLVLNLALVVVYVFHGRVTGATLRDGVPLVPGLVTGLAVGEALHTRVPEPTFRVGIFTLLLLVSVALAARA